MFRVLALALISPGRRWCTVAAAIGLVVMICLPTQSSLPALCGALSRVRPQDWQTVVGPISPLGLLSGWGVMLIAMMTPLFADPLRHVWFSTLAPRRGWAVLLCAIGYFAIWMMVAPVIIVMSWGLHAWLSANWVLPVATGAAIAWSASPWSQLARNRCHRLLRISACGRRADGECLIQGFHSGAMCVAVCWPWMVVPMLVDGFAHVAAMIVVSLWLTLERISSAREPHWQWPPVISQLLWRWRVRRSVPSLRHEQRSQNV